MTLTLTSFVKSKKAVQKKNYIWIRSSGIIILRWVPQASGRYSHTLILLLTDRSLNNDFIPGITKRLYNEAIDNKLKLKLKLKQGENTIFQEWNLA